MAIIKRGEKYQVRLEGPDGRILSKTFDRKAEAEAQERKWKDEKRSGALTTVAEMRMTVDEYFEQWFKDVVEETSEDAKTGWRERQHQQYRDFVRPVLGKMKLQEVKPYQVKRVLNEMAKKGKSAQTRLHAFGLMRQMFGDAVENYQCLTFNPAIRKLRPEVPQKEAPHLNLEQTKQLLAYVKNKNYGFAIWFQLFTGLRVGELQALRWQDIDLQSGRLFIRRVYVRKTDCIREYPKGRKQHINSIPAELRRMLEEEKLKSTSDLVVTSVQGNMISYRWYLFALKKYCQELGLPQIGTHGLRHSTSELYMSHGASKEDLQNLFAHSSMTVTERYLHGRGTNLERISNVIQLFPVGIDPKSTQMEAKPKSQKETLQQVSVIS